MKLSFAVATDADAPEIAALRAAAADRLTRDFGQGHWSRFGTERGVLRDLRTSMVCVLRSKAAILGSFRLATKKPWAIDLAYFSVVPRALYLLDMAVHPDAQRRGVGRRLVQEATTVATEWPSDAIRLDAYDAIAGAGPFYAKCGFREVARVSYRQTPLIYFELLLRPRS